MKAMKRVEEWMQEGTRWNVVFLYPEGDETTVLFTGFKRVIRILWKLDIF